MLQLLHVPVESKAEAKAVRPPFYVLSCCHMRGLVENFHHHLYDSDSRDSKNFTSISSRPFRAKLRLDLKLDHVRANFESQ